jgi:hypothetical protein
MVNLLAMKQQEADAGCAGASLEDDDKTAAAALVRERNEKFIRVSTLSAHGGSEDSWSRTHHKKSATACLCHDI